MPKAGTMHIGELAERTELSHRTIRHYDAIGLLTPSERSDGGFRLYTQNDYSRLMLIRRMKPLGYSLEEMGELLRAIDARGESADESAESTRALSEFLHDARDRRSRLARQVEMADEFIGLLSAYKPVSQRS